MRILSCLLILITLSACAQQSAATLPPTATKPLTCTDNPLDFARSTQSFRPALYCNYSAPPSTVTVIYFDTYAMTINRPPIPTNAAKCGDWYIGGGDVLYTCWDHSNIPIYTQHLVEIGTIIPSPTHPNCFWAGVVGAGAALMPAEKIIQLIGVGKILLKPLPGLAAMIAGGVYATYAGC